MIELGTTVQASVTRVEPFGIFLKHGDDIILVLVPEVSWSATRNLRERFQPGQTLDVKVMRYNYDKNEYVGSLRRLQQAENPYRELSRLDPRSVLRGKVTGVYKSEITLTLPNGARGHFFRQPSGALEVGAEVAVAITSLDVDEGTLVLKQVEPERLSFPDALGDYTTARSKS